ncbi:Crp/Fnr family transcriptional regulator [Chondrinema litorale]|uniref:Crp/Fnr family transcriptional regulator n=1 Tax=Chondrinema litorale TaxID=2994555 RepID=UPI0025434A38|nr:Crp/Fnr family transcriptional regulator [Chondrinema litorale]UZR98330.1 Crp/Fnr family transcriptional regulator [Chondrinema litorale]
MNNYLYEIINELRNGSEEILDELQNCLKQTSLKKGEKLLSLNAVCKNIWFIKKGSVRHYVLSTKGKEFNTWFSLEGDIVVAVKSFFEQTSTREGIELLEDCELLYISYSDLQKVIAKYRKAGTISRKMMERYYILLEERLYVMQSSTAIEKYEYLIRTYPEIIRRIPQNHIASYLGITKETLSRIRKKFAVNY